jgi:hypothetical protein
MDQREFPAGRPRANVTPEWAARCAEHTGAFTALEAIGQQIATIKSHSAVVPDSV